MTNEELVLLIQSGVNVEKNMAELYQQNINFIRKIALPFSKSCDIDDLMQEAYFGLDKAVKGYAPEKEFMFLTYAEYKIRCAIQRFYYNCGRTKRYPVHVIERISKYQRFKSTYQAEHGVAPTEEVILQKLNISKKQLNTLEKYIREFNPQSLDDVIPGTDGVTVGDSIADEYDLEDDITERIATEQNKADLWCCVDELEAKYQDVIKRRYGQNMSLSDLSAQENVSVERIRQLERKAFSILKNKNRVKEIALSFGFDCGVSYRGGLQRFKDTGISSTEYVALKRLELEQELADLEKMLAGVI